LRLDRRRSGGLGAPVPVVAVRHGLCPQAGTTRRQPAPRFDRLIGDGARLSVPDR